MKINKSTLKWYIFLFLFLIALSVILHYWHYTLFHDVHHLMIYLVGDIAFIPIEVIFVTLILHKVLEGKEKKHKKNKINMIIGLFFNEFGNTYLRKIHKTNLNFEKLNPLMNIKISWIKKDFQETIKNLETKRIDINIKKDAFFELKDFMKDKKDFLFRLLENPNLFEHDEFTDLLWSICHLADEIELRSEFNENNKNDLKHIEGDLKRTYKILIIQWLNYMEHLKKNYPYLFSLSNRTSPFKENINVIIK